MTTETSNNNGEVLEAISLLADHVQVLSDDIQGLKGEVQGLKGEIGSIKATMVTKSYLDDKLADLKGDMVSLVRKEDKKVNRLVEVLAENKTLNPTNVKDVLSFRVFP